MKYITHHHHILQGNHKCVVEQSTPNHQLEPLQQHTVIHIKIVDLLLGVEEGDPMVVELVAVELVAVEPVVVVLVVAEQILEVLRYWVQLEPK